MRRPRPPQGRCISPHPRPVPLPPRPRARRSSSRSSSGPRRACRQARCSIRPTSWRAARLPQANQAPLTRSSEAGKESNALLCPPEALYLPSVLSPASVSAAKVLLDAEAIEGNLELERTALVGIHTRGVPLAQRIRRLIAERAGAELPLGTLDISFYRDDVVVRGGEI